MKVYLDNSATTRILDESAKLMLKVMAEDYGNPSSLHLMGIEGESFLKKARNQVASAMGKQEKNIIFTSGGTEGDNQAIYQASFSRKAKHIITTKVEHPAVLMPIKNLEEKGFRVTYLNVDRNCNIDLDQLRQIIDEETCFVSIMAVNNEIGTIMPVEEISSIIKEKSKEFGRDILYHIDAVQSFGKVDLSKVDCDFMTVSGHKVHGPKGIGAMYVKNIEKFKPLIVGGGQERNLRSGTENTPAIAAFGHSVEYMHKKLIDGKSQIGEYKRKLKAGLLENIEDIIINTPENSVDSILNVSFLGTRGEVLLHSLEQKGIMVSTGSACSSNKKGQSHVLNAMALNKKEIEGAIRFSMGEFNSLEEVDYVVEAVKDTVNMFRRLGSFR